MKLKEALSAIDDIRENNGYTRRQKISWLSRIDLRIYNELIMTHVQESPIKFKGYTTDTPEETELLAPEPYDELYLRYLETQVDYLNADFDMYNASVIAFSDAYSDFEDNYNATHLPKRTRIKFF